MKVETIKSAVGVVASAGLILFVLFLQRPARPPEPEQVIDGSPVSFYTFQLRHAETRPEIMDKLIQNRAVFLPLLITQMGADESEMKRLFRKTVAQLPDAMRNKIELEQNPEVLRAGASWGLLHLLKGYSEFKRTVSEEEATLLLPALRNALKDESAFVRLNAATSLGVLDRSSPATKELIKLALHDTNWIVRYNAVYSLWNLFMDEKKIEKFIDEVLDPSEQTLRQEAAKNLKQVVARVLGTYDDPNDFE